MNSLDISGKSNGQEPIKHDNHDNPLSEHVCVEFLFLKFDESWMILNRVEDDLIII